MLLRAFLVVAVFFLCDWGLSAFSFLRARGVPRTVRRGLSLLLALGLVPLLR